MKTSRNQAQIFYVHGRKRWINLNIVIVGAGEVGLSVAKTLSTSEEKHNIYLIDNDKAKEKDAKELDVQFILGNGARPHVLAQAGVVQDCDIDILIACTNRDEINMLSCWIARNAGIKNVISRARNLEFTDSPDWKNKLGIKSMISPERSISREIIGLFEVKGATHAAELLDGRAALYTLKISDNSPLVNMALKDVRPKFPELMAVFVHVEHEDGVSGVPNGFTVLKANDICHVVTYKKSASLLQRLFQPKDQNAHSLRKLFIVGGGKLGTQIAQGIRKDFGNVNLRIIDKNHDRCQRLSEEFGEALIIEADGADKVMLSDEGIESTDGYVCATDSDELNLIYCAIAKRMGAKKTIAVVKRKDYRDMINCMPVDAIVDPNEALANVILQSVHYPEHTLAFSMIESINAEMLDIEMTENNALVGKTLMELKLPKGVIVALLGRGDEVLLPTGATKILAGDRVILFALSSLDISSILPMKK